MDLSFASEQEAFRRQVRRWLKANVPRRERDRTLGEYDDPERIARLKAWQRKLYQAGYLANEVFFDDVRVPRQNLVGELNQGWMVANATLRHERNMLGSTTRTQMMLNRLLRLARARHRYGRPTVEDPALRQRLADLVIRVEAMKYHSYRQLTDAIRGRLSGVGASVNKLVSTELNHHIAALALEVMGSYGPLARASRHVVDRGVWPYEFMLTLGLIIGGGTSQIQKNIISPAVVREVMGSTEGFSAGLHEKMAALGWTGLVIPPALGGQGMGMLDLPVLCEEMGRAVVPGPFLSSSVLAALALMHSGCTALQRQWLPRIASGGTIGTVAFLERSDRLDAAGVAARCRAGGFHGQGEAE